MRQLFIEPERFNSVSSKYLASHACQSHFSDQTLTFRDLTREVLPKKNITNQSLQQKPEFTMAEPPTDRRPAPATIAWKRWSGMDAVYESLFDGDIYQLMKKCLPE